MNAPLRFDWAKVMNEINQTVVKKQKQVYLIGFEDGVIKIGISQEPNKRIRTVEKQAGRVRQRVFISDPVQNAHYIERTFKEKFSRNLINGEVYNIGFAKALTYINYLTKGTVK